MKAHLIFGTLFFGLLAGGFFVMSDHQHELGLTGTAQPNMSAASPEKTIQSFGDFDSDAQGHIREALKNDGTHHWMNSKPEPTFEKVDFVEYNGAYYHVIYDHTEGLSGPAFLFVFLFLLSAVVTVHAFVSDD
jgi:hypothetical protein